MVFAEIDRYFGILGDNYGVTNPAGGYQSFQTSADQIVLMGRVDWELSDKHRFSARYNFQDFDNDNEWDGNFDFEYGASRAEAFTDIAHSFGVGFRRRTETGAR